MKGKTLTRIVLTIVGRGLRLFKESSVIGSLARLALEIGRLENLVRCKSL